MIEVGLLTIEQKDELLNTWYNFESFFNPIQDINDNWIISQQEIEQCINPDVLWVQDLPLIEYKPKIYLL